MSWIQKLYETYNQCAGAPQFASNPPLPIGHATQQAHIEIVIDGQGRFRRASVVPREDCTTIVPCTQESGGRSGKKPVSHPLCDKLQYVAADFAELGGDVTSGFSEDPHEPNRAYVRDLSAWSRSAHGHQKLDAILAYVEKGRVTQDLIDAGILPVDGHGRLKKKWDGDNKGSPPIFKVISNPENSFVRWKVDVPGEPASGTWEDRKLVESWIAYYASIQSKRGICMVTGENTILAEQHPAKLRNAGDKAKLISSNDTSGYTFRGRFLAADEACGVGFEVTQKAHNALRWVIGRQGYRNGEQEVVTWAVAGKPVPDPFQDSLSIILAADALLQGNATGPEDSKRVIVGDVGQAFAGRLNKAIAGYRARLDPTDDIIVMALDSATPGRMAITFYRELTGSEFLERVQAWHERYAWHQDFGKDKSKKAPRFIGAPSPKDIAEAAFGPPRDKQRKLYKITVERLLPCIIDGRPVPRDLVESAARRTCNRPGLERWEWEKNLGIACALFRGFHTEREYQMTLETDRTSRDYLYGRLLAIAEHLESGALYVASESRDTTAARLMQRFADRPTSTWRSIELALAPYKTRLRSKRPAFLHKMEDRLDAVVSAFREGEFVDDRRLSGEFLLGYHCERQVLKSVKTGGPQVDEGNADTEVVQGGTS